MAVCLLIPLVALIAILVFDTPVTLTALVGLALICPLSHFALMRTMADHDGTHHGGEIWLKRTSHPQAPQCRRILPPDGRDHPAELTRYHLPGGKTDESYRSCVRYGSRHGHRHRHSRVSRTDVLLLRTRLQNGLCQRPGEVPISCWPQPRRAALARNAVAFLKEKNHAHRSRVRP